MVVKINNKIFATVLLVFPTLHLSITNRNQNCNLIQGCFHKSRNRL